MKFYIQNKENQNKEMEEKEIEVCYFNKKKNDLYGDGFEETDMVYDYIVDNEIKYDREYQEYIMTKEQYKDMIDFISDEVNSYNEGYSEYLGEKDENIQAKLIEYQR